MTHMLVAQICFYAIALFFLGIGLLYMFAGSPMPYHLEAMQSSWEQFPVYQQVVITAIQRGSASGFLSSSIAIFVMTFFVLPGSTTWVRWCILGIGFLELVPTIYSVIQLRMHSTGEPPLVVLIVFLGLLVSGFFLSAAD